KSSTDNAHGAASPAAPLHPVTQGPSRLPLDRRSSIGNHITRSRAAWTDSGGDQAAAQIGGYSRGRRPALVTDRNDHLCRCGTRSMLLCLVKYSRMVGLLFFSLDELADYVVCWMADKTGMGHGGRLL